MAYSSARKSEDAQTTSVQYIQQIHIGREVQRAHKSSRTVSGLLFDHILDMQMVFPSQDPMCSLAPASNLLLEWLYNQVQVIRDVDGLKALLTLPEYCARITDLTVVTSS